MGKPQPTLWRNTGVASDSYSTMNITDEKTFAAERERAQKEMEKTPYCAGFIRVLDSRLARTPEGIEVVDWMKFEVDLCSKGRS